MLSRRFLSCAEVFPYHTVIPKCIIPPQGEKQTNEEEQIFKRKLAAIFSFRMDICKWLKKPETTLSAFLQPGSRSTGEVEEHLPRPSTSKEQREVNRPPPTASELGSPGAESPSSHSQQQCGSEHQLLCAKSRKDEWKEMLLRRFHSSGNRRLQLD
ncbi:Hypothetical predicted protein [Scomber scombrus]|uniref:Uncharacterized protein n=1 Tax=Scomber scombrus TaxID=13677 RepID=A0AAV1PU92_SCOSC